MKYSFQQSLEILERTPRVLSSLITGLSDDWIRNNEGPGTWSVLEVIGHLIVCERTNFMTRAKIILSDAEEKKLAPIDMTAQSEIGKDRSVTQLVEMFATERMQHLETLRSFAITDEVLDRTALHPVIGTVTLRNLLSTWVAHDLIHTAQIARVMARQYRDEVGPFLEYLRVLK